MLSAFALHFHKLVSYSASRSKSCLLWAIFLTRWPVNCFRVHCKVVSTCSIGQLIFLTLFLLFFPSCMIITVHPLSIIPANSPSSELFRLLFACNDSLLSFWPPSWIYRKIVPSSFVASQAQQLISFCHLRGHCFPLQLASSAPGKPFQNGLRMVQDKILIRKSQLGKRDQK